MLTVHVEYVGDIAIIECEGRIVRSEAAFKLRDVVTSQHNLRTIVLDISQVHSVEGGGLGILTALLKWAQDHDIQLRLFNPTYAVESRLESYDLARFDIATFDEMMTLLSRAEEHRTKTA